MCQLPYQGPSQGLGRLPTPVAACSSTRHGCVQRLPPEGSIPPAPGLASGPRFQSPYWLPVSILAGRTRCSPAYRPSLMPTASKQNPAQPLLTSLAPPSCCLPEFAPCSHHTKLLRFPRQTLLLPFCVLFQALPLPTGLGETQMSPPWGPFAGPAVAGSLTHAPSAPPPCALTACSELSTLDHDEHLVGQDVP